MMNVNDFEAILRGHVARNDELVRSLESRGIDLDLPRLIEHHFWAEAHRDGVKLAKELYTRDFSLLVLARVKTDEEARDLWNVEAELSQSIREASSEETAAHLIRIAASQNCVYDGWGTRLTE